MKEEQTETKRKINIKRGPDELESATRDFDMAISRLATDPSLENLKVAEEAEKNLIEIQEAYRFGLQLLIEHAQQN